MTPARGARLGLLLGVLLLVDAADLAAQTEIFSRNPPAGVFQAPDCTISAAPVIGQTFCFDSTANALKGWDGTQWRSDLTNGTRVVNVKDFGAKGDNTTDDTAAIQRAVNVFGTGTTNPGGTIFFPVGEYKTSSPITLPINVQLVGATTATDCTKGACLRYTSTTAASCALRYAGTINAEAYVKIQIRSLQIALSTTTTYAICLTGVADVVIDNVYIEGGLGGTNRGVYCQDCLFTRITRSHFNRLQYAIVADQLFNANTIASNQFIDMDQYAILLRGNVGGLPCCQGVWIRDNHFIKLAGPSTYQGAVHVVAPGQGITFEDNTLEVMGSVAVLTDRTDPISGGGSGFVDGLSVWGNLFVAAVGFDVSADYTRFSTLGPNTNWNPAGPQTAVYFIGSNSSNNVIPPGTRGEGKPIVLDTGIVDTLVSDSGENAFYTGIARGAADPTTTNWGDQNHAGRLWWNTTGTARMKLWDGAAIQRALIANDTTGAATLPGTTTVQGVAPSMLLQPTTANNAELWMRHGSLGTNTKFVSTSGGILQIFTADTQIAAFASAGGLLMGSATGGDKGAGTINAQGYYQNGSLLSGPIMLANSGAYGAIVGSVCGAGVECFVAIGTDGKIPAGAINAARHRIELELAGVYGTAGATDTINLKMKLCTVSGCGSGTVVQIATTGVVTPGVLVTNGGWNARVVCVVYTAGVAGTLDCQGNPGAIYFTALTTAILDDIFNTGTATVDTTVDEFMSVSATWNNASASDTITVRNFATKVY